VLPGTALILAGALLHRFTLGPEASIGGWSIATLALLTLLSYAIDLLASSMGAKCFGATRWGVIGGIVGTIVGLFFGLPGLLVGPLVGVFGGELIGGKELIAAGKSTWGTVLGTAAGGIAKFGIGLAMVAWFLFATLRH